MDFLQRSDQGQPVSSPSPSQGGKRSKKQGGNLLKYITVTLLISVTILVVLVIGWIATSSTKSESKYVDSKNLQAVFLNNGQVYFGNITSLNPQYVRLQNIYYLRVNQTVQPKQSNAAAAEQSANDVSLVKLGCELHGPADQMIINRDQVTFWENLKSDGQVAKAVTKYVQDNPDAKQNCATSTTSTTPTTNTDKKQ